MKAWDYIDKTDWHWEERDNNLCEGWPKWSCWCVDYYGDPSGFDDDVEDNTMYAVQSCDTCLGYGFMPISPNEVGL